MYFNFFLSQVWLKIRLAQHTGYPMTAYIIVLFANANFVTPTDRVWKTFIIVEIAEKAFAPNVRQAKWQCHIEDGIIRLEFVINAWKSTNHYYYVCACTVLFFFFKSCILTNFLSTFFVTSDLRFLFCTHLIVLVPAPFVRQMGYFNNKISALFFGLMFLFLRSQIILRPPSYNNSMQIHYDLNSYEAYDRRRCCIP